MEILKQLPPNGATAFGIGAFAITLYFGIQRFFKDIEDKLTPETKIEVWMWLAEFRSEVRVRSWTVSLETVFDRVFGVRHLSIRCFLRSCLLSYVMVIIGFVVMWIVSRYSFDVVDSFRITLFYAAIANVLPDYISLLETRLLLRWLRSVHWRLGVVAILVLDLLLTGFIGLVAAEFARQLALQEAAGPELAEMARGLGFAPSLLNVVALVFFQPIDTMTDVMRGSSPFFLAAFGTSIWLWMYVGSGVVLRAALKIDSVFAAVRRRYDVERYPLQIMGWIAAVICTFAWLVIASVLILL